MKLQKILKISKAGAPYIEIDKDLVKYLEWEIGDRVMLDTAEVWLYNRATKTCTLRNITQENYDRLASLILGIDSDNTASNREE